MEDTYETIRKHKWKIVISFALAFFIIFASYFVGVASMVPLWFAGAGLLKGFALTSIIGITVGVLITRPAFGAMVEDLLKEE